MDDYIDDTYSSDNEISDVSSNDLDSYDETVSDFEEEIDDENSDVIDESYDDFEEDTVDEDSDTEDESIVDTEEDTVDDFIETSEESYDDFEEDTADEDSDREDENIVDIEEDTITEDADNDESIENIQDNVDENLDTEEADSEKIEENNELSENAIFNETVEEIPNEVIEKEQSDTFEKSETFENEPELIEEKVEIDDESIEEDEVIEETTDFTESDSSNESESLETTKNSEEVEEVTNKPAEEIDSVEKNNVVEAMVDSEETAVDKSEEFLEKSLDDKLDESMTSAEMSTVSSDVKDENGKSLRERVIHPSAFQTVKIARNMHDTMKADDKGYKTMNGYRVGKTAHNLNSFASSIANTPPGQELVEKSIIDESSHVFDEVYSIKHPEERFDFRTPSEESEDIIEKHTLQIETDSPSYEVDETAFNDISNEIKKADGDEYKSRINVTPINNGKWVDEYGNEGVRGEAKWCPNDQSTQELLKKFGVDGIEYKNGYPDFESVSFFSCYLEPEEFYDSDRVQFDGCNFTLLNEIEENGETAKLYNFDEEQINDLENGKTPYGYTWHHDTTEEGRLLLVPTAIHQACRHSGGRSSWGGGSKNR